MNPILYDVSIDSLDNGMGFGILSDALSCVVTEERNGQYEADIVYPAGGQNFSELLPERIVRIDTSLGEASDHWQLFRIKTAKKMLSNDGDARVEFHLVHIFYDLDGFTVMPGTYSGTPQQIMTSAIASSPIENETFTFYSDIVEQYSVTVPAPISFRKFLFGAENSLLNHCHGEFYFNNTTVEFLSSRADPTHNLHVRYGKNLVELVQNNTSESIYTHLLPFAIRTENDVSTVVYRNSADKLIELTPTYSIGRERILTVDLTSAISGDITAAAVSSAAAEYIQDHELSSIITDVDCAFEDLRQYQTYESLPTEEVSICDFVTVYFSDFGIDARMQVIKTEFDSLARRYTNIQLGTARSTLAGMIAGDNIQLAAQSDMLNTATRQIRAINEHRVIETGTDANGWSYQKWSDGRLTANKMQLFEGIAFSQPAGYGVAYTDLSAKLPSATMANSQKLLSASTYGSSSGATVSAWVGTCRSLYGKSGSDADGVSIRLFAATTTATTTANIQMFFAGRWQ